MKIIVYAICKNEEKFVDRWYESMKEADDIYVLDTGSTDHSVERLEAHHIHVISKIINPWRFDVARNLSLSYVPLDTDICVCTDLDEVLMPGWRTILEENWKSNTTRASYTYHWRLDENDNPLVSFFITKIHTRNNYQWSHPVHEVLTYTGNQKEIIQKIDQITVHHYPDDNKSRSSYLPLLELSVQEDPDDDRNMHYLGREYMYYGYYDKAIDTLQKHLTLKKATWKDERCASMRFIARCYLKEKKFVEANAWADKAIQEAPYLRDPYMEKAMIAYEEKNWNMVILLSLKALQLEENPKSYINEIFCKNKMIYDILSIAYYEVELYDFSYFCINKAMESSPNNTRLIHNYHLIKEKKNQRDGNIV